VDDVWRDIDGYAGLYQVSRYGEVRGLKRGRLLKPAEDQRGYRTVNLYRDGQVKHHFVHRLVAAAFLGSIPEDMQVNHIDGDKSNNALPNLEIVTAEENKRHAKLLGLIRRGEDNHKAKLTEEQVREIRQLREMGERVQDIAYAYGVTDRAIYLVCRRLSWSHVA
jgi:HNH endonuclease/NUMOD4 motif